MVSTDMQHLLRRAIQLTQQGLPVRTCRLVTVDRFRRDSQCRRLQQGVLRGDPQGSIIAVAQKSQLCHGRQSLQSRHRVVEGRPDSLALGKFLAVGGGDVATLLLGRGQQRIGKDFTVRSPRLRLQDHLYFLALVAEALYLLPRKFWLPLPKKVGLPLLPVNQGAKTVETQCSVGEVGHGGVDSRARIGEDWPSPLSAETHPHP